MTTIPEDTSGAIEEGVYNCIGITKIHRKMY